MESSQASAAQPFVRDKLTWLTYLLAGHSCYVVSAMGPLMPFIRSELNMSYTTASFHFSAWACGGLIAGLIGDHISNFLGRPKTIWIFGALISVGVLILCTAHSPFITVPAALLAGTSGSIMGQTITAVNSDRFGEDRAIAISEINITASVCAAIAPAVGAFCVKNGLGWRATFALPVVTFITLALLFRSALPPTAKATQFDRPAPSHAPLIPAYWAYWLVILFLVSSEWSMTFWSADFLEKAGGVARADASLGVTCFLSAMLLGRLIGAYLARSIDIHKILPVASAIAIFGFLTFWLGPTAVLKFIGLFFTGLGIANFYPMVLSAAIGTCKDSAKATARMSISAALAVIFAPLILGMVADKMGIFNAYGMVAAFLVFGAVMILLANWLLRKSPEDTSAPGTLHPQPSD